MLAALALVGSPGCYGLSHYFGASECEAGPAPDRPAIAVGSIHTCALSEAGAVRCWGFDGFFADGYYGDVGRGTLGRPWGGHFVGDDEVPASTGDVEIGEPALAVAAGGYHTCVLLEGGRVRCWGVNMDGDLGYGNLENVGDDEVPAEAGDVDVGGPVVQLAAGNSHTCAVLEGGRVRCWGNGRFGRLGYGDEEDVGDDETPASAGDVDVGGPVRSVAAGSTHTCVVLDGGGLRCWGENGRGELGLGHTEPIGDDETPATAPLVDVGGPVLSVSAGSSHTCAVLEGGSLRCWGRNDYGVLGLGHTEDVGDDESPAEAGEVQLSGPARSVSCGFLRTCAVLESGRVHCWGSGTILGYGNEEDVGDDETPAEAGTLPLPYPAWQVGVGGGHMCALLCPGRVRCWGAGEWGRLGYGNERAIGDDESAGAGGDVRIW